MRALAIAIPVVLLGASSVPAHEGIHAENAQEFLKQIDELNAVIASVEPPHGKADALYALGETLANVIELLNRDLASRGGEVGILLGALVAELEARGIELSFSQAAKRYDSYLRPFEEYLALAPGGSRRADAMFRIVYGRFYDSFVYDPMKLLNLDWAGLEAQIEMAESFLSRYPSHTHREEAQFILAVDYLRAAGEAPGDEARQSYRERARAALAEFRERYPESLRAAAAQVLLERLPPVE